MGQKQLLLKVQQNSDEDSGAALICKMGVITCAML